MQEKTSDGVRIGINVWIGPGDVIINGATIRNNIIIIIIIIIGPNSVVTKTIPDNSIVQSIPAKGIFIRR